MDYGLTDILSLLGALGLFLYGMKVMSDALMELAGDRMRSILSTTTSNRFFAVLTGFTITAIIQSSSATTLMVVSFANASLLTLTEAIGVIMGANIGTTVTAWLISILGFKVSMNAIALPLVGLGFLLTLLKHKQHQHWGYFIIGFAVLFLGLQFLSDAVPDIRHHAEVLTWLSGYTRMGYLSILLFLLIGTLLTLVIQSSSAAMALTLLMTFEGWIPFDMAVAMVLGQNIGTTITANLAAMVANYHAKRAARAHLLFNLLGVVLVLPLIYPFINLVAQVVLQLEGKSPLVEATAVPVALSLFHTSFNILNTLLLVGFIKPIAQLVERIVPAVVEPEAEIDQPVFIDEASLKYPQTAIKAMTDESLRLLNVAGYEAITHGLNIHREDMDSDKPIKELIASTRTIEIDIDELYAKRIKSIYSRILQYATTLQSRHALDEGKIEIIRNILIADRILVRIIKQMKPLHKSLVHFLQSNNHTMLQEYNLIRKRILKVVREIRKCESAEDPTGFLRKLKKQGRKADELDVLLSGRVEQLLRDGNITDRMATTLLNDSEEAKHMVHGLIDMTTLLYYPRDRLVEKIVDAPGKASSEAVI